MTESPDSESAESTCSDSDSEPASESARRDSPDSEAVAEDSELEVQV